VGDENEKQALQFLDSWAAQPKPSSVVPKSKEFSTASTSWDASRIADQEGRVIIATGSTSGIGKETARVLANKNGTVILAVRNVEKGRAVAGEIRQEYAAADVIVRELDLSSLESVRAFTEAINRDHDRLDLPINNAGVMMCPYYKTSDGFEIQMGTNHLGHFALTGLLMPLLEKTEGSRVVALSSGAHAMGNIDLRVTAAHPGWRATKLQRHVGFMRVLNVLFAQKVELGALPTLRAAFDEDAQSGDFFGPQGMFHMRGYPVAHDSNGLSHDPDKAKELWRVSEELTGVRY
jgi:NADP-dependent 3-hydroxy acid dehydrogenase YdfG